MFELQGVSNRFLCALVAFVVFLSAGVSVANAETVSLTEVQVAEREAEVVLSDAIQPLLRVEFQDEDTSLVQDIDPATGYLKITARKGNEFQVMYLKQSASEGEDSGPQKSLAECALVATLTCGEGNVESVDYESTFFGLIECCHYDCAPQ